MVKRVDNTIKRILALLLLKACYGPYFLTATLESWIKYGKHKLKCLNIVEFRIVNTWVGNAEAVIRRYSIKYLFSKTHKRHRKTPAFFSKAEKFRVFIYNYLFSLFYSV